MVEQKSKVVFIAMHWRTLTKDSTDRHFTIFAGPLSTLSELITSYPNTLLYSRRTLILSASLIRHGTASSLVQKRLISSTLSFPGDPVPLSFLTAHKLDH